MSASSLEILYRNVSGAPGLNLGADAHTLQTEVAPNHFADLYICEYQPAFDRLETVFAPCPALLTEMQATRDLALGARQRLEPVSIADAPRVQALLGLACYVAVDNLFITQRLSLLGEMVNALGLQQTPTLKDILRNHLVIRWPQTASSHAHYIDILADTLAKYCKAHSITLYSGLTPPDSIIEILYKMIDIIRNDNPVLAQKMREEEDQSPAGKLFQLRQKPTLSQQVLDAARHFGDDLQAVRPTPPEPPNPVAYAQMLPQYHEAAPRLPSFLQKGSELCSQIQVSQDLGHNKNSPEQYTKVERITLKDGRTYIRKTYLKHPLMHAERGLIGQGLANTIRFSHDMGPHAPQVVGVTRTPQGEWQVWLEDCTAGDLLAYMKVPENRNHPLKVLGMAYLFSELLAIAEAKGIHHRDIKLANVFVQNLPTSSSALTLVLADYDHSIRISELPLYTGTIYKIGTFFPPEAGDNNYITGIATDIYAGGMGLLSIALGSQPKSNTAPMPILQRQLPRTDPLYPIIEKAISIYPDRRFTTLAEMHQAVRHALLKA